MITMFVDPPAMVQTHFEGRRNAEQILSIFNCQYYTLPGFPGQVKLAGTDGEQHIEVRVTLCDVGIEDAKGKCGGRHDVFLRCKSCFCLDDMAMRAIDKDFLLFQDNMIMSACKE